MLGLAKMNLDKILEPEKKRADDLYLSPEPKFRFSSSPGLHSSTSQYVEMKSDNLLEVYINDMCTFMYVDSGCTSCFIQYEKAQELDILKYTHSYTKVHLYMW